MIKPGMTFYAHAASGARRTACEFCGRPLTPHQAVSSGNCGSPECHARAIEKAGEALLARRRRAMEERIEKIVGQAGPQIGAALQELGAPREQVSVIPFPWQGRPVEPLPEARRAAFRAHLEKLAGRVFAQPVPSDDLAARAAGEAPEPAVVCGACATCQGHCCANGGDTALLVDADIARYRQRHPEATAEEVIEAYLACLPETSTRDGCVYQAADGCRLPRPMRQEICNDYYCDALRWLNRSYRELGTGKVVYVAGDDDAPRRVAAFDLEQGYRPVAELPPAEGTGDTAGETR